ncbi:MAG: prepilin-type N-terminal cleavage/methylation domain-containing protein [Patescibacteria group bacterium]
MNDELRGMKKGVTMTELVIVVAVVLILTAIAFQGVSSFRDSSILAKAADDAGNIIKDARSRTLSSVRASSYGVRFATSSITLFQGSAYVANDPSNEILNLPGLVQVSSINLTASSSSIVFARLTGQPAATGTVTLLLERTPSKTKKIIIRSSGLYEIQ